MLASHQVIQAIGQRLLAAGTGAGSRVNFINRALTFSVFPGLKVYADGDDFSDGDDDDITWPREQLHALAINVDGVVRDVADLEAAMATLAAEVLTALEGTEAASVLDPLDGVRLASQAMTQRVQTDGEFATGTVSIRFLAVFSTASNDPATIL